MDPRHTRTTSDEKNNKTFSKSNLAPSGPKDLRIGIPGSSALQNDGFDVPVILQCRTLRETNHKSYWRAKLLFEKSMCFVRPWWSQYVLAPPPGLMPGCGPPLITGSLPITSTAGLKNTTRHHTDTTLLRAQSLRGLHGRHGLHRGHGLRRRLHGLRGLHGRRGLQICAECPLPALRDESLILLAI
jgi:hypothetical protein